MKITLLYLVLGLSWVLYFCELVELHEKIRDTIYVTTMAWLLYWLIDHGVKAIRSSREALKESEQRLAGILETSPCGILLVDGEGVLAYANLAASNILGVKRSEVVGRPYNAISLEVTTADGKPFPEEQRPANRVLRDGKPIYDMECAVRVPSGERVILSFNSAPLHDGTGKIAGIVIAFIDITERKRAQDLMLRKLSLAVEQSPSAIMVTDTESRIEYVNPQYTKVTGYSRDEVIGTRTTTDCAKSPESCRLVCETVCVKGEWKDERRSARKNGEEYWETISVSPIRGVDGVISHYLWVREDVTEHRKADEALRESRAKFQNLVETINDWVWETDRDGVYTYVSPKIRELLGYEPEEVLGRTSWDLMPKDEANRVAQEYRRAAARREPFQGLEKVERRKDGRLVTVETSGVPFFDAKGAFLGYRGVDRDVSARKHAEDALRESEERFRELFEQTEEPILIFASGSAKILDANPAAVAVYGYTREELVSSGPSLFVGPDKSGEFETGVRSIREGHGLALDTARHYRKDGTPIIVSVRGKAIRLKGGLVSYCTVRDITDRVRMEEEAKIQQAKLIHANRMTALGTIVSGVAHEVSNPNNLVMFNAPLLLAAWQDALPILLRSYQEDGEFLMGGVPFTEMRLIVPKLLKDISDSSQRIKSIVGMLKDFARQDTRRLDRRVNLNDVVRTAVAILRHEIMKGTRDFRVACEEELPAVFGWAMELEQVVINLIVNSLQALPDASRGVRISTAMNGDTGRVEIRVEDEGAGMSPETLARLTEPFFSTKLERGGLGLGLSISQTIIKEHGGTLTFHSEVGKGTVACIALPAAPKEESGQPEKADSRALPS